MRGDLWFYKQLYSRTVTEYILINSLIRLEQLANIFNVCK